MKTITVYGDLGEVVMQYHVDKLSMSVDAKGNLSISAVLADDGMDDVSDGQVGFDFNPLGSGQ